MRRHAAWIALLVLLAPLTAGAQSSSQSGVQAAAPGEPQIVMPQVILQVEDLSVEKVVAQLPPADTLLPPDRPVPVLSEGDLAVGDPVIPAASAPSDQTVVPEGKLLSSDITLGAGMQNRILGSLSLKTLGPDPRFAIRFDHETVDGLAGHPPGSGFNTRSDLLDGSLKFGLLGMDTSLGGTYAESENGLQGLSPYGARLVRSISGNADFSGAPLSWLSLDASAAASTDSLTLELPASGQPFQRSDLRVSPAVSAQARFGVVTLGLKSLYSYRTDSGIGGGGLHRFSAGGSISASLPGAFLLAGDVGWFWNSDGLSLVPFSLSITGTPWDFLTVSLSGGYKVQTYDLHDILASSSFAGSPAALLDDHGWFGTGSLQLTITRDLSASVTGSFMASNALPVGSATVDPGTGLFPVVPTSGYRFSTDSGLRWGISSAFSLAVGWHEEWMQVPFFTPLYSLSAEIVGIDPSGRFGGTLSATSEARPGVLVLPVLRLSGFWKVSDSVRLQLDADDLLWPLLTSPRTDLGGYLTPGLRVTGSIGMSL